jgi:hypothetical protein
VAQLFPLGLFLKSTLHSFARFDQKCGEIGLGRAAQAADGFSAKGQMMWELHWPALLV